MNAFRTLAVAVLLTGCATSRLVSHIHPHANELLIACTTDRPLYLYRSETRQPYDVFKQQHISFQYTDEGRVQIVREANYVLPAGTRILGEQLTLEHSMGLTAGVVIYGTATLTSGEVLSVRGVVESVAVDLVEWQEQNGAMSMPTTSDYLARVSTRIAPWCPGS